MPRDVLNTRLVLVTVLVLGLAGCATPAPLDNLGDELARHRQALPPALAERPLTVDDAVRLAVAHNLDLRVKVMEAELATGKAELSRFAMLPQMSLSSAATVRSRVRETTSRDTSSGTDGTSYSTSEDKRNVTADLSLSWNLVDLGLAVLRSGEEDDRVIIADEKRRRAMHLLVQDVRVAYWKAVVNETSERRYRALEGRLNEAVGKARAAESEQVSDPMQLLNHQRAIIDSMRQIAEMQRQSATARSELTGLMGVASVANFQLVQLPEDAELPVTVPGDDIDALEREALASRPEVQVDESQFRIDVDEVRAEMLKTIPGIGPFLGGHYDSTSFVRNNAWADAGLRVAWSLSDLISAPRRIDNARAAAEVTRARRMASAMAVMTQVNVADNLYRHAFREYQLTRQMAEVDGRIRRLSGDARKAGSGSEIEEMKAQAASALSSLRRLLIYADLEGAKAKRDAAIGRDPLKPEPLAAKPEPELSPAAPPVQQPPPPATEAALPSPATEAALPSPATEAALPSPATEAALPPPATEAALPPPATEAALPTAAAEAALPPPAMEAALPSPATEAALPTAAAEAALPSPATEAALPPPAAEAALPTAAAEQTAAPSDTALETAAETAPSPSDKGRLVYLASFRTAAGARRAWDQMKLLAPSMTGQLVLRPVDLGRKGRFIRVFATARDDVHTERICRELAVSSAECGIPGRE